MSRGHGRSVVFLLVELQIEIIAYTMAVRFLIKPVYDTITLKEYFINPSSRI